MNRHISNILVITGLASISVIFPDIYWGDNYYEFKEMVRFILLIGVILLTTGLTYRPHN